MNTARGASVDADEHSPSTAKPAAGHVQYDVQSTFACAITEPDDEMNSDGFVRKWSRMLQLLDEVEGGGGGDCVLTRVVCRSMQRC